MTDPGPGRAATLDEVLGLYDDWGSHHYDEELSQRDHAIQTAALAVAAGAADPLVAAALLHDVGHLQHLADGGADRADGEDLLHEARGARYLAGLFGPEVTGPVALHVQAKRYRCAVDPAYHDRLSAGSKASLDQQGGPLEPSAAARFAELPGALDAVALRAWDDGGKVDGLAVPPLAHYRPLLERLTTSV